MKNREHNLLNKCSELMNHCIHKNHKALSSVKRLTSADARSHGEGGQMRMGMAARQVQLTPV